MEVMEVMEARGDMEGGGPGVGSKHRSALLGLGPPPAPLLRGVLGEKWPNRSTYCEGSGKVAAKYFRMSVASPGQSCEGATATCAPPTSVRGR